MDCNETRRLLDADLDGELDLVTHLELEQHTRSCAACQALVEGARERAIALRERLPRHGAPAALRARILRSLPKERPAAPVAWPAWRVAGLAACVAFALVGAYNWGGERALSQGLYSEAVAEHVRSLQAGHLTDVLSTDQHTVKPWFAGKIDFAPPVVDLAAQGFPLVGGRLDYIGGKPAAALVFHRGHHAVNLFVWRSGDTPLERRTVEEFGYRAEAWSGSGLNYMAVSEIPLADLQQFTAAYRERTR